jgi:hypothetical protein
MIMALGRSRAFVFAFAVPSEVVFLQVYEV